MFWNVDLAGIFTKTVDGIVYGMRTRRVPHIREPLFIQDWLKTVFRIGDRQKAVMISLRLIKTKINNVRVGKTGR